jgi:hypothetical protein
MGPDFRAQATRANELAEAVATQSAAPRPRSRKRRPPRDSAASAGKPMGGDPLAASPPLHSKRQRKPSARAAAATAAAEAARGKKN